MENKMSLAEYFENAKGVGILSTSNSDGNVNTAIYSRPYIIDENTVAFSMLERLSYANVQSNPKAAYMFIERGEGYSGKRLYLTMTNEEKDPDRIQTIKQQHEKAKDDDGKVRHLMYFSVDRTRPLVGG